MHDEASGMTAECNLEAEIASLVTCMPKFGREREKEAPSGEMSGERGALKVRDGECMGGKVHGRCMVAPYRPEEEARQEDPKPGGDDWIGGEAAPTDSLLGEIVKSTSLP